MNNKTFKQKTYSLISVLIGSLSIVLTLKINIDIANRYLQSSGKTKALFGIIEILEFHYQYYHILLIITALPLAIIGTKRKESKFMNRSAYVLSLLALLFLFSKFWKILV